jgi:hypothetical protein
LGGVSKTCGRQKVHRKHTKKSDNLNKTRPNPA